MPLSRNTKIPGILKSRVMQATVFVWFMYNLGSKFIRVSALWGSMLFWDRLGFVFVASYLMVTIVGGTLALVFTPRSWCQFCPMGTMQTLMYKLGKALGWTRKHDRKITASAMDKCHKCAKCARVCPFQLEPYNEFSDKNQFDHEACIRCLTCVQNCPAHILTLSTEAEALQITQSADVTGYDKRQTIRAEIANITELTLDTREYTFRFIEPTLVKYLPGQFFLVKIQDGPEIFRAYSISGMAAEREVRVAIKRIPQGYGTGIIFDSFVEGAEVILEGPMGKELLVDPAADKVLLVAGGIGITPFIPILQDLAQKSRSAKLVYGVNTLEDLIFDDTLSALAQETPQIDYLKVVANPPRGYTGLTGFVTDAIKNLNLTGYKVYMCGSKGMVDATTKTLISLGVLEENIFAESA